ncbi:MAG: DUF4197 domain-containing protein [Saprospiraceae bacterium]
MKKIILGVLFTCALLSYLPAQTLGGFLKKAESKVLGKDVKLSKEEIGEGLKEALNEGVGKAVSFLSAENGYYESPYKILLPKEAQQVIAKVKAVPGFGDVEEKMNKLVNRAAEDAATKAKPIFVKAIKKMTFKDAMNILMGEKNAATQYLDNTTRKNLFSAFMPVIQTSLDKVKAREYWRTVVKAHNKLPFVKDVTPELDAYVTTNALNGMFKLVEKKELDIRGNQSSRTTDLLTKVFSQQD